VEIAIHVVHRLYGVVEEIKEKGKTNAGNQRQEKGDKDVSKTLWANRRSWQATIGGNANLIRSVAVGYLKFPLALQ
jgi:hypothetical protein